MTEAPAIDMLGWRESSVSERHALLERIAAASKRELQAVMAEPEPTRLCTGGPRLIHRRSGLRFCFVPGDVHRLGRTTAPRRVELPAFLLCETPLSAGECERLYGLRASPERTVASGDFAPFYLLADELPGLERDGLRLPSDDEWEAAYRAGTTGTFFWGEVRPQAPPALPHPLGLAMMAFYDELTADGWVRGGAARLWPWRADPANPEWVWLMSAARRRWEDEEEPRDVAVRLALTIV